MAIAEDPTIFDYDASYDQIQAARDEKIAERKKADKERKSKYALDIIKAHKRRELEQQSREERQQQKERVQEGVEFADKEVFVTGAYRKQMEEVQKFREEEAYEKRFNELTSVEHQQAWQAGFGRTLLNELARGEQSLMQKGSLHDGEEGTVKSAKEKDAAANKTKIRNIRRRNVSDQQSSEEEEDAISKSSKTKTAEKKSIYSDDEDDSQPKFEPPKKNFPGELKPGLNRVVKAPTKSEKLKERQFTPTPPSSDNEDVHYQKRRREKTEQKMGKRRISNDRKESTESLKKRIEPKKDDKQMRLVRLKEILKQRNGPEEIEEFRKRYLERKESGVVVPPL
ncbi:hypothetical protein TELCIR_10394 [Teladorsagia circumcincta]|uniref:Nuclear speckle splicing regulatory protein 1 N-terminal domain-containing protein n=1 Tax=Teladorsagia circumcincta TaxID=45464 RepID=A0A2G9UC83_TELCI|nr:hypothetical protein TELCIR_10394 [Teladorsagia circumcincta]